MPRALGPAITAVTICTAIQWTLLKWLLVTPFSLYYAGVAIVAWFLGFSTGVLTAMISALVVGTFRYFHPLFGASGILSQVAPTTTFLLASSVIAWFCDLGRAALLREERLARYLAQTQSLYDALFANMREALVYGEVVWQNGEAVDAVYLAVNGAFDRLTGFGKPIGRRMTELVPEFVRSYPEVLTYLGSVASTGNAERFECFVKELNAWFTVSAYCPTPGFFVAVFDDVSAQHESENALRLSEERYRVLFESSQDAIVTLGLAERRFTAGNAASVRLFGLRDLDDLVTRAPWDLSPLLQPSGQSSEELAAEMIELALGNGSNFFDWTHRRLDGSEFEANVLLTRVVLGGAVQLQATVRDVSEKKRIERALIESERNYRTLLDEAGEGVLVAAADNRAILYANQAISEAFGYSPVELCQMTLEQLQPPELERKLFERMRSGAPLETKRLPEVPCRRKDGTIFWADIAGAPLPYNDRLCILGFFHDVTERREMQRKLELEQRQRQAVELELRHAQKLEAIGQLAAGIAHEINTPSQFVSDSVCFIRDGFSSLVEMLPQYRRAVELVRADPEHAAFAREIENAELERDIEYVMENVPQAFERCADGMQRVASIVRAMKEFAHPGQRERSPADLNRAIQNTLTIARNEYKYLADVVTRYGDVPPVFCNIGDLNQVFLNLIVNAAHAIASAVGDTGNKGTIYITTSATDEIVEVEIRDTGCGIPAGIQSRIFEPFFTTKEVGKGTGQGLAISRSVVDRHGGTLTFKSVEGQGTSFWIRLPRECSPSTRAQRTTPAPAVPRAEQEVRREGAPTSLR
jgi:PAS domain S-box-containing protein